MPQLKRLGVQANLLPWAQLEAALSSLPLHVDLAVCDPQSDGDPRQLPQLRELRLRIEHADDLQRLNARLPNLTGLTKLVSRSLHRCLPALLALLGTLALG